MASQRNIFMSLGTCTNRSSNILIILRISVEYYRIAKSAWFTILNVESFRMEIFLFGGSTLLCDSRFSTVAVTPIKKKCGMRNESLS